MNRYLLGFIICILIDLYAVVIAAFPGKIHDHVIEKYGPILYLGWMVATLYAIAFLEALTYKS